MYNHELTLVLYKYIKDDIGNNIKEEIKTDVLCRVQGISSNEFYNSATIKLKPEIKFIMHNFEYLGQKEVIYNNQKYVVVRTYKPREVMGNNKTGLEFDEIELTCERMVGI